MESRLVPPSPMSAQQQKTSGMLDSSRQTRNLLTEVKKNVPLGVKLTKRGDRDFFDRASSVPASMGTLPGSASPVAKPMTSQTKDSKLLPSRIGTSKKSASDDYLMKHPPGSSDDGEDDDDFTSDDDDDIDNENERSFLLGQRFTSATQSIYDNATKTCCGRN